MNAVASLNLSKHDEGVAAIAHFPIALDWLAIPFTPATAPTAALPTSSPTYHAPPSPSPPPPPPPTPPPTSYPTSPPASPTAHHPHPHHVALAHAPPFPHSTLPTAPLSSRQAASALVRHVRPSAAREVLAPCFRVAGRFVLGRLLGALYVPPELRVPHLAAAACADARFVLDLQHGSLVEVRRYPAAGALLCVAYAARRAEFLALPPGRAARVEIAYRRDHAAAAAAHAHLHALPQSVPLAVGPLFDGAGRGGGGGGGAPHTSWHHFCINYASIFPTGPVTAAVTCEPGVGTTAFKKEAIMVTVNDAFAMSFCAAPGTSFQVGRQARRIAPKRLLPRPAT